MNRLDELIAELRGPLSPLPSRERRLRTEAADELARLRGALGEADILLTELVDGPSKGEFYGIGPGLRAKLRTVRDTTRAALTPTKPKYKPPYENDGTWGL